MTYFSFDITKGDMGYYNDLRLRPLTHYTTAHSTSPSMFNFKKLGGPMLSIVCEDIRQRNSNARKLPSIWLEPRELFIILALMLTLALFSSFL